MEVFTSSIISCQSVIQTLSDWATISWALKLAGHSINSYTRYSVALLSSNDGQVGLPANRGYDTYLTFSQAFQVGSLGLQRFGAYAYIGERPTFSQTTSGTLIPGTGMGNKSFYRVGFSGDFFFGNSNSSPCICMGTITFFSEPRRPPTSPFRRALERLVGTEGLSKPIITTAPSSF